MNVVTVQNWFMSLVRDAVLSSMKLNKRVVTRVDIHMWSDFEVRMRHAAEIAGTYYKPYDITRMGRDGKYRFDSFRIYMWVEANMSIIRRVRAFKPIMDTASACKVATASVGKLEGSQANCASDVQEMAQDVMRENYRQLEIIWGDVEGLTPCNNMGVKNNYDEA